MTVQRVLRPNTILELFQNASKEVAGDGSFQSPTIRGVSLYKHGRYLGR